MTAESSVLLSIRTKLSGATDLKSAIDMVAGFARKISDTIKELDKFQAMMATVDMEMVNYADSMAKGQVSTDKIISGLQKLNQSGVQITKEQLGILTARATELAQATGKDATEAFERLTTGIARGSSRALSEYGIKLKESTNLSETQKTAIDSMTKGYEDINIELLTSSERLYAVGNNIGTLIGAVWNVVPPSNAAAIAIDELNGVLGEFSTWLTETPDSMSNFIFSLDGLNVAMFEFVGQFLSYVRPLAEAMDWLVGGDGITSMIDRSQAMLSWASSTILDLLFIKQQYERQRRSAENKKRQKQRRARLPKAPSTGGEKINWEEWDTDIESDIAGFVGEPVDWGEWEDTFEADVAGFGPLDQTFLMSQSERALYDQEQVFQEKREQVQLQAELRSRETQFRLEELRSIEDELQEMRESSMIAMAEAEITRQFRREQDLQFAQNFAETWRTAMDAVSAGALAANSTMQAMRGTMGMLTHSIVTGADMSKDAWLNMISGIMEAMAVEAAVKALFYAAEAIVYGIMYQYDKAALAGAAAGMYTAVAITAGGIAAATYQEPSTSSAAATSVAAGSYASGGYQTPTAEQEPREVHIYVTADDSATMWKVIHSQNKEALARGDGAFAEAV